VSVGARLGDSCPVCGRQLTRRHRPSKSIICDVGHYIVDRDAGVRHGVQQIASGQREGARG